MSALLCCLVLCMNCGYAVAALSSAARYGIVARLGSGTGLAMLMTGTAVEYVAVFTAHGAVIQPTIIVAFGAVVVAAACDAACGYVFDAITVPSLVLTLAVSAANHTTAQVLLGAAAAGGSLYILHVVSRGRGLGLGDVKLACCIGACAGAIGGLEAIGLAFVLGGAYSAFLLLSKRARFGTELRFAPYLAAGLAIIMVHGAAL